MVERTIKSESIFRGRVFSVEVDEIDCGGRIAEREVVRHSGGVAVLALEDDGRVVMVRQFRYALGRELLELPAGKLEEKENPMAAAVRELEEETGYIASAVEPLGQIVPTGGYNSEVLYLFLATGLIAGESHPDEGEFLSVELVPFDKALAMVLDGRIEDAKTAVGLMKYELLHR